jgi:hypothetical protein
MSIIFTSIFIEFGVRVRDTLEMETLSSLVHHIRSTREDEFLSQHLLIPGRLFALRGATAALVCCCARPNEENHLN